MVRPRVAHHHLLPRASLCSYTWIVPIPYLKGGTQQDQKPGNYWLDTQKGNTALPYLLAPGPCSGRGAVGELSEDSLLYFTQQMELMPLFPTSPCFCVVLDKLHPSLAFIFFLSS